MVINNPSKRIPNIMSKGINNSVKTDLPKSSIKFTSELEENKYPKFLFEGVTEIKFVIISQKANNTIKYERFFIGFFSFSVISLLLMNNIQNANNITIAPI